MENSPSSPGSAPERVARRKVSSPAVFLMGVGGVAIVDALLHFFQLLTAPTEVPESFYGTFDILSEYFDELPFIDETYQVIIGPAGYLYVAFTLAVGVLMFVGGLKMKNLEGRGLAMTGALLALFPSSYCCVVGLPVGIWALLVLRAPEVKAAFRR